MVEIITILFIVELALFAFVDYCKYGTVYTPVVFLGGPFAVVMLFAVYVNSRVGFLPVTEYSLLLWCCGLLLFWIPGCVLTFGAVPGKLTNPFAGISGNYFLTKTIQIISWISLAVLFISCANSFRKYGTFRSDAFSTDFASHGVAAHCLNLMKFNAAYLFAARDSRKMQNMAIIGLTFLFLLLYNVKGAIFLTALVCLFAKFIVSQSRLNIRKVIFLILLGTGIFAFSYYVSLGFLNIKFLVFHFIAYFVSGIVGLSEYLRQGGAVDTDFRLVFLPLTNFYYAVTGGEIITKISDSWVATSLVHVKNSNVKTFFGDIYISAGIIKGGLIVSFFGFTSYLFLVLTILKKSIPFLILYLFVILSLMLGWFAFYFNSIFYYEITVYVILVSFIAMLARTSLAAE
jgi:hypothetical protein